MPVTLSAAVGQATATTHPLNLPEDVRAVQTLLVVAHRHNRIPTSEIAVDGQIGPLTVAAMIEFQKNEGEPADGVVSPGSPTLAKLNAAASRPVVRVLRQGRPITPAHQHPYTIALVANPALEAPEGSNQYRVDPITWGPTAFDNTCGYVVQNLFCLIAGQAENLLTNTGIGPHIRVVSVFQTGLDAVANNSLVAQDGMSNLLIARRDQFLPFLAALGIQPDVAYGISKSPTHNRASAWFTTDDQTRGGVPFTLDDVARTHWYYCRIPGTVALPAGGPELAMTPLHEFGHAASSYSDGAVVDQYVDGNPGVNNKRRPAGPPIPPVPLAYGTYQAAAFKSDPNRDSLGYGPMWVSYHCTLTAPAFPCLMDDYWRATPPGTPGSCMFDQLTRQFLTDRLIAKIGRP